MKAAFLPDRGVVKVSGEDARRALATVIRDRLASVGSGSPASSSATAAWAGSSAAELSAFRIRVPSPRARITAERTGDGPSVTRFFMSSSEYNGRGPNLV